jgi:hypothetical protein
MPAEHSFGADPEKVREAAPHQSWKTISTKREEIEAMTVRGARRGIEDPAPSGLRSLAGTDFDDPVPCSCDDGCADQCDPDTTGPPSPTGVFLASGHTFAQCDVGTWAGFRSDDADADGLLDSCETELATVFRPRMAFASNDLLIGA